MPRAGVQRGCLVIADVGGYTRYLKAVELEHAHDVLADLIGTVAEVMGGALEVAKLEGDAVFAYEPRDARKGDALIALVEAAYFAFARRLRDIDRLTTCTCRACRAIPDLDLKFVAHHGEFVVRRVAGSRELVGADVILLHRLLKNTVTRRTGVRAYALLTDACTDALDLDTDALGLVRHEQSTRDVGRIGGWVLDLDARWADEQQRETVHVGSGEASLEVTFAVPAPPAVVWEYLTSAEARPRYGHDVVRVDQASPRGVRGVGTTNHCVHGKTANVDEEIVDWKPFRYYTLAARAPAGQMVMTWELTPSDGGTVVALRCRPARGLRNRLVMPLAKRMIRQGVRATGDGLARVVAEDASAKSGRASRRRG